MNDEADSGSEAAQDRIVGRSTDEAVEAVLDRDDVESDRETVRAALSNVSEDGVVTKGGIRSALGHVSKVVSTPETRLELAESAVEDAREAAGPVDDVATVAARLEEFDARLAAVEDRLEDVQAELGAVVELRNDPDATYEVARRIQALTDEANRTTNDADRLSVDAEEFEAWLADPEVRADELAADLEALSESLDELAAVADGLAAAGTAGNDEPAAAASGVDNPEAAWVDAAVRVRVADLLVADVRAELADLRELADRQGTDATATAELEARVDDLAARRDRIADRLASRARPGWTDRHGERLASLEADLAAADAPVDWGAVQATIEEYQVEL
jgi:chromosome segregation ATPase